MILPPVAQFGSCLTQLKENVEEIAAIIRRAEELLKKLTDQVAELKKGLSARITGRAGCIWPCISRAYSIDKHSYFTSMIIRSSHC
jgi:hypothetical protein